MFKATDAIHVQIDPSSDKRVLHAARVVDQSSDHLLVAFIDSGVNDLVDPPREVAVFFKNDGRFVRQSAVLGQIIDTNRARIASLQLIGPVEPAEDRECFRAITVMTALQALVNNRTHCDILDISATGLAIQSTAVYMPNQSLAIAIEYEEQIYSGPVRVRNNRALSRGNYRYGLFCYEPRSSKDCLVKGLSLISIAIQREQLRRLAGQQK